MRDSTLALIGVAALIVASFNGEDKVPALPVDCDVFSFSGTTVCYDRKNRCPRWVMEHLTLEKISGDVERSDNFFSPDVPQEFDVELDDYRRSGYDRGHLAPAGNFKGDEEGMKASFNLANVIPQNPTLNRGLWAELEQHCRNLVANGDVWVVTVPIYWTKDGEEIRYKIIGKNRVSVPTHIGKSILYKVAGEWEIDSYVMPNERVRGDISDYWVTTDYLEHISGIDVFSHLPDGIENALEGVK